MAKQNKKVDITYVNVKKKDTTFPDMTFYEMITSDVIHINRKGDEKDYSVHIVIDHDNYLIGYVSTVQHSNLPPLLDNQNQLKSIIDDNTKGAVFCNIFLYIKDKNVIMYESNQNGTIFKTFIDHIESCYRNEDTNEKLYSIEYGVVYDRNEYDKILSLDRYTKLKYIVTAPASIMADLQNQDAPLYGVLRDGVNTGSDTIVIEHKTERYATSNLNPGYIKESIRCVKNLLITSQAARDNIKEVEVKGYIDGDKASHDYDLLGTPLSGKIKLERKRSHTDLQITDRRNEIIALYERINNNILPLN